MAHNFTHNVFRKVVVLRMVPAYPQPTHAIVAKRYGHLWTLYSTFPKQKQINSSKWLVHGL